MSYSRKLHAQKIVDYLEMLEYADRRVFICKEDLDKYDPNHFMSLVYSKMHYQYRYDTAVAVKLRIENRINTLIKELK